MSSPVILKVRHVIDLHPTIPFDFDSTLHKPDHFPSTDTAWEPGIRWQTMLWQNQPLGLKFENRGTREKPHISLSIWAEDKLDAMKLERLAEEIEYRFNLQLDLDEFNRKFESDPQLKPVLERWSGMRPMCACSLYEYLMIAIVLQNATVRRSVNMMQALLAAYGKFLAYDGKELYCFWQAERLAQVSEEELRGLKIGYRAKSIKRVTDAFIRKEIDEFELRHQQKADQRKALLNLYGIGPASVGYILFDVFHHWDELEHISPWEQKIYSKLFFDIDPEDPLPVDVLLEFFNQHFGAYRMLAVHYFWEDLFWKRKNEPVDWLEALIRL